MTTWNPNQYLRFADERTRPCDDLIARIRLRDPRKVIDLGCGPGNSTAAIGARWPAAQIAGLDSSREMLERARDSYPQYTWLNGDVADWVGDGQDQFDLVFSNAALHWLSGHDTLFPQLLARVADGGALAIQMPANLDAPAQQLMRELADSPKWRERIPGDGVRGWFVHDTPFYYDLLAPIAGAVDLWETTYFHVMPDAPAIAQWYRGTGLRPFLDALPGDAAREEFVNDYSAALSRFYHPRPNERVLFPFRRLFVIATRGSNHS